MPFPPLKVLGAAIPLGQNWNSGDSPAAGGSTYIAFLVITLIGATVPFFLTNPANVVRSDGSLVTVERQPTWISEFKGLYLILRTDPWVMLLFPFFLSSNWFYSYQFNGINGSGDFTFRSRSLNNCMSPHPMRLAQSHPTLTCPSIVLHCPSVLYWTAQIVGSAAIGFILDNKRMSRKARAYGGWAICFVFTFALWGGNYANQRGYNRASVLLPGFVKSDVGSSAYAGKAILC